MKNLMYARGRKPIEVIDDVGLSYEQLVALARAVNDPSIGPPVQAIGAPWVKQAECRDYPREEDFYVEKSPKAMRRARTLCYRCPVRSECLTYATAAGELFGIWAGSTPPERDALRSELRHERRLRYLLKRARSAA